VQGVSLNTNMSTYPTVFQKTNAEKIVLLLSVFVAIFWCLGRVIDIYRSAIVGAVFEILWLPMIGMMFVLPIIAVFFLIKEKFSFRSLHLYSILILALTLLSAFVFK
jgi:hypothetical protein